MMRWIIACSLKFRLLIVALAAVLIILGVYQLYQMPVDTLSEFAPPYIEVQTEAPGLSVTEVEELVTFNLEALLSGLPWVQSIHSTSIPGLSSITLTFQRGTDIIRARQLVSERLNLAYTLPNVALSPIILQPLSATSRVMMVGLSSTQISLMDLSVLAHWTIRPALLSIPGVANIAIWGMRDKQLQVLVDPSNLQAKQISLEQIIATTGNTFWVSPLSYLNASTPGSGGWIETPQQRLEIRHQLPISTPADLAKVSIEGSNLQLGDATKIVEGYQPLIGDGINDNAQSLLIVIEKFPRANALRVTKEVEAKLAELQPGLSGIQIDTAIFKPAMFVQTMLYNLGIILIIGFLLLAFVLFTLLHNWRAAVICLITTFTSLAIAILLLALRDTTINAMVLAGLVMAIAIVIDESMIDIENILRYLAENRKNTTLINLITEACLETRGAMIYALLIVLLTLVPVFLLNGIADVFLRPVIISYALALIAAMLTALVVTPALYLLFFSNTNSPSQTSSAMSWLNRKYTVGLEKTFQTCSSSFIAIIVILISIALSIAFAFLLTVERPLVPAFKEPNIMIQWEGAPGTSIAEMTRITQLASRKLQTIPGVNNVAVDIGRAVLGDQIVNVNSAEFIVNIDPKANYDKTIAAIKKTVNGYPGIFHVVRTYLNEKIRQVLTGSNSDIVVRLFGSDLHVLYNKALEVKEVLAKIKGTHDIHMRQQANQPQITIKVDLEKAKQYGIKPGDIRRAASTYIAGIEVGSLFEEQKVFQVEVWGTPETRHSLNSVRDLLIHTPSGKWVKLTDVATVNISPALNFIQHEAISRRLDIDLNVRGYDISTIEDNIKQSLKGIKFPLEYHAKILDFYQQQQDAFYYLLSIWIAITIGVILLLQASFASFRFAFALAATMPTALLGSLAAAFMIGSTPLTSLFGLFVVFGITLRHSLILIKHYQGLNQDQNRLDLIVQGAQGQFTSLIVTVIATMLVLAPLAFSDLPGQEVLSPIALIIFFGLISSTIFSLFIVPCLYLWLGEKR